KAFSLSAGVYTTLNIPTDIAYAYGLNDKGDIVGWAANISASSGGFLLTNNILMLLGPSATSANGINDAGQIVGLYWDGKTGHGYLASPLPDVPLSPSMYLFATGLALMCLRRRRKQST